MMATAAGALGAVALPAGIAYAGAVDRRQHLVRGTRPRQCRRRHRCHVDYTDNDHPHPRTSTDWALGKCYGLAIQSDKLWVSFNPMQISPAGLSRIGYFDLSQAKPSFVVPNEITDGWYSAPDLAADPGNSGILIAYQPGMDPADVASYNVAGSTVTTLAAEQELRNNGTELCANAGDLAVVPGGSKFIIACGWPYAHYYYSTTSLQMLGHYNSDAYPDAVVIAPNTGLVALGVDEPHAPSIYIYRPGGARPLNTYASSYSDTKSVTLATRGLSPCRPTAPRSTR